MTATMTRNVVEVTCACGALFLREVKRGRPQIWCPKCVAIPFYDRVPVGEATVKVPKVPTVVPTVKVPKAKVPKVKVIAVTTDTEADAPVAPVSQFDAYAANREQIELDVAAVYVDHAARYAARIAAGTPFLDAASATSAETREALKSVYARYPKKKDS